MIVTKKIISKKGFTLVELLCVIVVMILVSAGMIMGIRFGIKAYSETVAISEAQVLCRTLSTLIKDDLRYVSVRVEDGEYKGFFSSNYGEGDEEDPYNFSVNSDGYVVVGNATKENLIVSKASYTHNSEAQLDLQYDLIKEEFSVILKIVDDTGNELAKSEFIVIPINKK